MSCVRKAHLSSTVQSSAERNSTLGFRDQRSAICWKTMAGLLVDVRPTMLLPGSGRSIRDKWHEGVNGGRRWRAGRPAEGQLLRLQCCSMNLAGACDRFCVRENFSRVWVTASQALWCATRWMRLSGAGPTAGSNLRSLHSVPRRRVPMYSTTRVFPKRACGLRSLPLRNGRDGINHARGDGPEGRSS